MCMLVCLDVERPLNLSKATLTSRTEKIRRENIRLNNCSCTLKEGSDSDDMVRQKSSKKQRKSCTCWSDAGMLTFCKVRDRSRSVRPAATCVGMLRYSMTTTRKVKDLCSPRGAKKVFLGTSSTVTLLEKIRPGMSDSFETWQEYFWTIDASFQLKKEG